MVCLCGSLCGCVAKLSDLFTRGCEISTELCNSEHPQKGCVFAFESGAGIVWWGAKVSKAS